MFTNKITVFILYSASSLLLMFSCYLIGCASGRATQLEKQVKIAEQHSAVIASAVASVQKREAAAQASAIISIADLQEQLKNEQLDKKRIADDLRSNRRRLQLAAATSGSNDSSSSAAIGSFFGSTVPSNIQEAIEHDLIELASECDRLAIVHLGAQWQLIADRKLINQESPQ